MVRGERRPSGDHGRWTRTSPAATTGSSMPGRTSAARSAQDRSRLVRRIPWRTVTSAAGTRRACEVISGRTLAPRGCGRDTCTVPSSARNGGSGTRCRSNAVRWEATPPLAATIAAVSSGAKGAGASAWPSSAHEPRWSDRSRWTPCVTRRTSPPRTSRSETPAARRSPRVNGRPASTMSDKGWDDVAMPVTMAQPGRPRPLRSSHRGRRRRRRHLCRSRAWPRARRPPFLARKRPGARRFPHENVGGGDQRRASSQASASATGARQRQRALASARVGPRLISPVSCPARSARSTNR